MVEEDASTAALHHVWSVAEKPIPGRRMLRSMIDEVDDVHGDADTEASDDDEVALRDPVI
jgi:hypothetical protein